MSDLPLVEGAWPGRLRISRGWARAHARPWNDESDAAQIRMVRGSADFLDMATTLVTDSGGSPVYSPALFPGSTRVWSRAGYQRFGQLLVMERALTFPWERPGNRVGHHPPDWDGLVSIDRMAFQGFWRMGRLGLEEAAGATRHSAVFTVGDPRPVGYAIVGTERGVGYLQRIAVVPQWEGQGIGTDLVLAAMSWARDRGARTMVLNVREDTDPALRLYRATGFHESGTRLAIMERGNRSGAY